MAVPSLAWGLEEIALDRLQDGLVLASARRLLALLGKRNATSVSLADATNAEKLLAERVFNGDGVITPESVGCVRAVVLAIIASHGSVMDRSGKPGVDRTRIEAFFAEARAVIAWHSNPDSPKPGSNLDEVPVAKLRAYVAHESTILIALEQDLAAKAESDSIKHVSRLFSVTLSATS